MRTSLGLVFVAAFMSVLPAYGQPNPTYKVDFNIRDLADTSGKNARHYSLLVVGSRKAVLKVGSRVPVATGSFQPGVGGTGINPLVNTQYTYLDIGTYIECSVADTNGKLGMHGNIDLSTVVQHDGSGAAKAANPTVGQTRLELDTNVEPGKPTVNCYYRRPRECAETPGGSDRDTRKLRSGTPATTSRNML